MGRVRGFLVGVASCLMCAWMVTVPKVAIAANTFTPDEVLKTAGQSVSFQDTKIDGDWINARATSPTAWLPGVAVSIFVLKEPRNL